MHAVTGASSLTEEIGSLRFFEVVFSLLQNWAA